MRWPFRRKDAEQASVAPESASPAVSGDTPEVAPRRSSHQWATLPPLPVTVKPSAPLVMGPAPVLEPLPGPRRFSGTDVPPANGRVDGLVHPVPARPEPPIQPSEPAAVVQPPLVHRPVHSGPPAAAPSLTDAVGSYVGEARQPAEPYRAPGWLRFVPEWLQQSGPSEADLGMASAEPRRSTPPPLTPKPAPVVPQRVEEAPPAPQPEPVAVAEPAVAPTPPSLVDAPDITTAGRRRRANLGQSRRLGLGAPIKRGPDQELVLPPEPARIEQTQAPQAIEARPAPTVTPAPVSGPPAQPADDGEEAPEPPPAPPPQPPPLVHRPVPEVRAEEPDVVAEPARPAPEPAGPVVPSVVPKRVPGTPASTAPPASSVPLVYRSAPARPDQAPRSTVRRGTPVPVPTSLVSAIRHSHGVDVTDVLVHRGPDVAAEARSLGARAFTRDAEVFLPEDAGSLDSARTRGLLAHELVHVVQQRTLGSALPALSTPAGAALEAEAVAAEHEHSGLGASMVHSGHSHAEPAAPLVHPVLTQVLSQAARTAGVQLAPLDSGTISSATPPEVVSATGQLSSAPQATSLSEPVREEVTQISEVQAIRVLEQWTNPALGGTGFSSGESATTPFPIVLPEITTPAAPAGQEPGGPGIPGAAEAETEMANQVLQVVNMDRAAKGEPALTALDAATMEQIRRTIAEQTEMASRRAMMFASATAASTQSSLLQELQAQNGQQPATTTGAESDETLPVQSAEPTASDYIISTPLRPQQSQEDTNTALRGGQIDIEKIDLDELSTRLYDRLRSRLRLELLIDRERAGLLSDFR